MKKLTFSVCQVLAASTFDVKEFDSFEFWKKWINKKY